MTTIIALAAFYLIVPILMLGLRLIRPNFRAYWFIAVFSNLVLWTGMLLVRMYVPISVELAVWEAQSGITSSLFIDPTSWAIGISLSTLCFAGALTDISRPNDHHWSGWAGGFFLTGLGLLAVFSGNLVTLALSWVLIDILEIILLAYQMGARQTQYPVTTAFFLRITSVMLLIIAIISGASLSSGSLSVPDNRLTSLNILLLVAAILRIGIFPTYTQPEQAEEGGRSLSHSLNTILRFASAAAGLSLVVRIAQAGVPGSAQSLAIIIFGATGLYSAYRWATASDLVTGRFHWILGMSTLAVSAAILALPETSLVWTLAVLLPGGLVMFSLGSESDETPSRRGRAYILPIAITSAIFLSSLPYTPTWSGLSLYTLPLLPGLLLSLIAQAVLFIGFIRWIIPGLRIGRSKESAHAEPSNPSQEKWVGAITAWGMITMLIVYLAASYWSGLFQPAPPLYTLLFILGAVVIVGALALWINKARLRLPEGVSALIIRIFSLQWLVQTGLGLYALLRRVTRMVSFILEGEGGVLWSLLLLILLLTVLLGSGAGR